jgi:hypothetical protein
VCGTRSVIDLPRGGRRTGTPGQSYSNRLDLNVDRGAVPVMAASGQQYGAKKAQMDAQRAMPIAAPPAPAVAPVAPAGGPPTPPGPQPGQVVPLDAPTARPNEPLTAGLDIGAGSGSEVNPFAQVGSPDDAVLAIRAAFAAYPAEEFRAILERVDLQ